MARKNLKSVFCERKSEGQNLCADPWHLSVLVWNLQVKSVTTTRFEADFNQSEASLAVFRLQWSNLKLARLHVGNLTTGEGIRMRLQQQFLGLHFWTQVVGGLLSRSEKSSAGCLGWCGQAFWW